MSIYANYDDYCSRPPVIAPVVVPDWAHALLRYLVQELFNDCEFPQIHMHVAGRGEVRHIFMPKTPGGPATILLRQDCVFDSRHDDGLTMLCRLCDLKEALTGENIFWMELALRSKIDVQSPFFAAMDSFMVKINSGEIRLSDGIAPPYKEVKGITLAEFARGCPGYTGNACP